MSELKIRVIAGPWHSPQDLNPQYRSCKVQACGQGSPGHPVWATKGLERTLDGVLVLVMYDD